MYNPEDIRKDFPILSRLVGGKRLVYLDSAATSQKPKSVIDAISNYYNTSNANVHRGAHTLGDEATTLHLGARDRIAKFIGASDSKEIIFVRNTTEALNLVAYSWGRANLKVNDKVVLTEMEHHSNMVPWQEVAFEKQAKIEYVRVLENGEIDIDDYEQKVRGAKIVAFVHISNALGTINNLPQLAKIAKKEGAVIVIDGAQSVPHIPVDISKLGVDFFAFSGHKMLGPMGIGVLWGRREILESMPPFLSGGGMISEVTKEGSSWAELPEKFEAGTPDVAGAVGLSVAIDYLEKLGMENVRKHDMDIVEYSLSRLGEVESIRIIGSTDMTKRSGSVSFEYRGVHAHDVATIIDSEGVAVRSGHHCTMVLHNSLGVFSSVRASFNVYTTHEDVDRLIAALGKVREVMGK